MIIHFKLFYYQLCSITKYIYAYLCINMFIGSALHIVKTPRRQPTFAHTRVHPHKLRARKNRLSTPCGVSSRFINYEIRSVDMHRIIPRILYASSS